MAMELPVPAGRLVPAAQAAGPVVKDLVSTQTAGPVRPDTHQTLLAQLYAISEAVAEAELGMVARVMRRQVSAGEMVAMIV
jgi:hypothetical protein